LGSAGASPSPHRPAKTTLTTDQAKPGIPAAGLAVLPDDRYAVTGGADGAVRVWKLPDAPTAV
jgi:WD40 repeat protein